ncbi:MAG TPA: hypothetical protein VEF76_08435 [Patescibacteria group bacterium]|nr:hypothetical protein [Patescibacteria group bacterium]
MSLSASFNQSHSPSRISDSVLALSYDYQKYFYDFELRLLTTVFRYSQTGGVTTPPFSQLDRETLVDMRDKLVELGGKPRDLPPEAPTLHKPQRGLQP